MAQRVKALDAYTDGLDSVLGTLMIEGENWLPKASSDICTHAMTLTHKRDTYREIHGHMDICTQTCIYTHRKAHAHTSQTHTKRCTQCICTHTHTETHGETHTHRHSHSDIHIHKHTYHTNTHTHSKSVNAVKIILRRDHWDTVTKNWR